MKLIILIFLAVLLSCGGSSELSDQNGEVKAQFSGLNDDVLYIIASQLKLMDLLSLAQVNSGLSAIAGSEVRCRYRRHSKLEIIIRGYIGTYNEDQNQLTIQDAQMALNVLKYFGKYFAVVAFNFNDSINSSDLNQITQYLNIYCAKSLAQLELDMTHNLLGKFEKPFEAVEELMICLTVPASNETIRMNDLFPQLRRLKLRSGFNSVNYDFINSTFPYLEHLHVFTFGDEDVREIIRRNPTIRSIKPQARHPSLIKFISQYLPNLENLTIYHALNEGVRFENVKCLEFMTNDMVSIEKLSMPQLESLKMSYNPSFSEKWMEYFKNNTQLRRLFIVGNPLDSSIVLRDVNLFTADLPDLIDVTFQIKIDTQIDSIIAFFENHRKLISLKIADVHFDTKKQQILQRRLGNVWSIKFKRIGGFFQRNHAVLN